MNIVELRIAHFENISIDTSSTPTISVIPLSMVHGNKVDKAGDQKDSKGVEDGWAPCSL